MDISNLSKATRLSKVTEKAADLAKVADKAADIASLAEKTSDVVKVTEKAAEAAKLVKNTSNVSTVAEKAAEAANLAEKTSKVAQEAAKNIIHRGTETKPYQLFNAIASHNPDALDELLKTGIDVNGVDHFGQTALHKVAFEGKDDIVKRLLAAGADPLIADTRDRTPIFWAAARGKKDAVKSLLEAGSNPNIVDTFGNTALDVAVKRGKTEVAQILEAAGAKPLAENAAELGGKLDFSNRQLQLFNDELSTFKSLPFIPPGEDRLATYYKGIFGGNEELLKTDNKLVTDWTGSFSSDSRQVAMRYYWEEMMQGKAPSGTAAKEVYDTIASRKERWNKLSQETGIQIPESFTVYRGIKGDEFVDSVAKAWRDDTTSAVQVSHHTLSSWSLDKKAAENFTQAPSAVLLEADIPFDMTVMDKWVDDGEFIKKYSKENEVVVGTMKPNTLTVPKEKVTVSLNGTTYTYAQKDEFLKAWNETPHSSLNP